MTENPTASSAELHNTLSQVIYVSAASEHFRLEQLPTLIDKARKKNARLSVTGLLTYSDGCFFQVLEGEHNTVNALYEEISQDPRHSSVVTIFNEPIARRSFSDWDMHFVAITPLVQQELGSDLREFVENHQSSREIGRGRAAKLVAAFEAGKWRVADLSSSGESLDHSPFPEFSMAFQPIVDVVARKVHSHEALIRGPQGQPAFSILNSVDADQRAAFDLLIRNKAVQMAADLELGTALNLNFLPSAALNPETSLCLTIDAAAGVGFPADQIIFEATETEFIDDLPLFAETIKQGQRYGFQLAVDDFGAGNAGLRMLADFQPDYVKMDMALVRDIESKGPRQAIARAVTLLCEELGMSLVVEGVETVAEYRWLRQLGIRLFQGFLFAKPMFEGRPLVRYPKD